MVYIFLAILSFHTTSKYRHVCKFCKVVLEQYIVRQYHLNAGRCIDKNLQIYLRFDNLASL